MKGIYSCGSFIPKEHAPSASSLPMQAEGLRARAVPVRLSHGAGVAWLLRDLMAMVPGPAKLCHAGELHPR